MTDRQRDRLHRICIRQRVLLARNVVVRERSDSNLYRQRERNRTSLRDGREAQRKKNLRELSHLCDATGQPSPVVANYGVPGARR
jgi:hypothetical protein